MPPRERLALLAALALGLVLRVAAAQWEWSAFDREFPRVWEVSKSALSQDGTQYLTQAGPDSWRTPHFRDWAERAYYRPPLASFWFAALFPAVHFDRVSASAAQAALAVLAYGLLFALVRPAWGRAVAWIALGAVLVHPVLIYYDTSFEDSALCLVSTAAAVAVAAHAQGRAACAAAGLLIGLAILARPNVAIAAAGLAAWIAWPQRDRVARLAAFALPALALASAASVHNYRASGRWSIVTETSGENLYWGNNSRPDYRVTLQGLWAIGDVDAGSPGMLLIDSLRRRHAEPSVDAAFAAGAREFFASSPGAAARGFAAKAARHLAAYEIPRNENLAWLWDRGLALWLPYPPYAAVLALAAVGALTYGRRSPRLVALLALPWLTVFATEVVYFNAARYRALALPFLAPLAVVGAGAIARALRRREFAAATVGIAAVAAALLAGPHLVSAREQRSHRSASQFKAAMLQLVPDPAAGFAILDAQRFERDLADSLRLDPDNLEAFSIAQKVAIAERRFEQALAAIDDRAARCAPDDDLCQRTCAYLRQLAQQRRSRS